jgi:beta-N-acetylhexosaminidase
MAMTAHIVFTAIDPDHPATQSAAVLSVIRNEIGFDGLLLTDDLNMQALDGDLALRTTRALTAGCDIALHCNGDLAQMDQVAAAAGTMSAQTRLRAGAALARRQPVALLDIPAAVARLADLAGKIAHV